MLPIRHLLLVIGEIKIKMRQSLDCPDYPGLPSVESISSTHSDVAHYHIFAHPRSVHDTQRSEYPAADLPVGQTVSLLSTSILIPYYWRAGYRSPGASILSPTRKLVDRLTAIPRSPVRTPLNLVRLVAGSVPLAGTFLFFCLLLNISQGPTRGLPRVLLQDAS